MVNFNLGDGVKEDGGMKDAEVGTRLSRNV